MEDNLNMSEKLLNSVIRRGKKVLLEEEGSKAIAEVSRLAYTYFWHLSLSTRYGRRLPPSLLREK